MEKIVEHLDNSISKDPSVFIRCENPFGMRMKMYRYIKAFKIQKEKVEGVDESRYDHLVINENVDGLLITSSLGHEPLVLTTEEGETL